MEAETVFCGHGGPESLWMPDKWSKLELTIGAKEAFLRTIIVDAASKISAVCGLNIRDTGYYWAINDLKLSMVHAVYDNGLGSDGPGNRLAYMYYPERGDGYFDAAEKWALEPGQAGYSLPAVALHELMHGVGVVHTSNKDSVIYPYLRSTGDWTYLRPYDIEVLQGLYGPNTTVVPEDGSPVDWEYRGTWAEKAWTDDATKMGNWLREGKIKARTYEHDQDGKIWRTFGVEV